MSEKNKLLLSHFKNIYLKVVYRDCANRARTALGFLTKIDDDFIILENKKLGDIAVFINNINTIAEMREDYDERG